MLAYNTTVTLPAMADTDARFELCLPYILKEEGGRLKREMSYNEGTGDFTWLRDSNNKQRKAGDRAGGIHGGYVRFKFSGVQFLAHQVAWWWVHGSWPELEVDHINGIRNDNRIENLRLATAVQQRANAKLNEDNTSGHRGVYWNKKNQKWRAHIRRQHLGYFADKDQAAAVYNAAFDAHFGAEFRRATG